MLKYLLPLLCSSYEKHGDAYKLTLKDGTMLLCNDFNIDEELAKNCPDYRDAFTIDYYRFSQRTTVCHVLHNMTGMVFVGWVACPDPAKFSKRVGQELSLRKAAELFLDYELYKNRWVAEILKT